MGHPPWEWRNAKMGHPPNLSEDAHPSRVRIGILLRSVINFRDHFRRRIN